MPDPILGAVYQEKVDPRYKIRVMEREPSGGLWWVRDLDSGLTYPISAFYIDHHYELEQA